MLVDTHCHLDVGHCPEGANAVLQRAGCEGVRGFVAIGVGNTLLEARESIVLTRTYPSVVASVGVHPHDAHALTKELFSELRTLALDAKVVAIGETGLDYAYEQADRTAQREVFAKQIALARQVSKPLVIHTRHAAADTLELLRSEQARETGGVIHCFTEDKSFAREVLDLGFLLSFSGILTFKNASMLREVAAWAPLESLLLETDSPYLSPVPLRGKPCEPAYMVHTAKCLAVLKGISLENLEKITTQNAERCFRWPFSSIFTYPSACPSDRGVHSCVATYPNRE